MKSITISGYVNAIVPIGGTRFADKLNFDKELKLKQGDTFIYDCKNKDGKIVMTSEYRVDRIENDIYMFSHEYKVGFNKGNRVFYFSTTENKPYPIMIPYKKLDSWIEPYRKRGETVQSVIPEFGHEEP